MGSDPQQGGVLGESRRNVPVPEMCIRDRNGSVRYVTTQIRESQVVVSSVVAQQDERLVKIYLGGFGNLALGLLNNDS